MGDKIASKKLATEATVNTIPGSLAFYLFEPMGISYRLLIDKMVDAALLAHRERQASSFSYTSVIHNQVGISGGKH